MENSKLSPVDSVRRHITEKMLSAVLQDLKVCSGFMDFMSLYDRVFEYMLSLYGVSEEEFKSKFIKFENVE